MPILGEPHALSAPAAPVYPQPPMQRSVNGPLSMSGLAAAREAERIRAEWDTMYITADQARSIPEEAMTPELQARIKYSQRDWPENRLALSAAMGPLGPGEGETYALHGAPASELFWEPGPEAKPPEHMLPGRRGIDRGERR